MTDSNLQPWGFPGYPVVKNLPANVGDAGLILSLGRSPGVGSGNPLQYSALESPWAEEPGGLQFMVRVLYNCMKACLHSRQNCASCQLLVEIKMMRFCSQGFRKLGVPGSRGATWLGLSCVEEGANQGPHRPHRPQCIRRGLRLLWL